MSISNSPQVAKTPIVLIAKKKRRSRTMAERLAPCDCCGWPLSERHHLLNVARHGENNVTLQLCANCHEAYHIQERAFSDFAHGERDTANLKMLGVIARHLGLDSPIIKRLQEIYDLKWAAEKYADIFV